MSRAGRRMLRSSDDPVPTSRYAAPGAAGSTQSSTPVSVRRRRASVSSSGALTLSVVSGGMGSTTV